MNPLGEVVSITGPSGEVIPIAERGVTFIVGGNNAGKSTVLQEIAASLRHTPQMGELYTRILKGVNTRTLEASELVEFVRSRLVFDHLGQTMIMVNGIGNHITDEVQLTGLAPTFAPQLLPEARNASITMLDGASRLTLAQPIQNVDVTEASNSPHPMLRLLHNEQARDAFNSAMFRAFQRRTTVDGPTRMSVQLRMDELPDEVPLVGTAEYVSYVRDLEKLEPLTQQGDGMKAFAGLILTVLSHGHPYIFIDEPEAFLHPPQARELGAMLHALSIQTEAQVFIATHSRDIILGAMDADVLPSIVRISSDESTGVRKLTALPGDELSRLWADPIVRFSNVLDGIFYRRTVICEDNSDSKWFQAGISAIREHDSSFGRDTLFVGAGGKHKLPTLVSALTSLGVEVRVAADFDALKGEAPLRKLVTLLGGLWDEIAKLHGTVNAAIAQAKTDWAQVGSNLQNFLATYHGENNEEVIAEVFKEISLGSADSAKHHGVDALTGASHEAATELLKQLDSMGIVLLKTGETESFCRSAGGHGSAWVDAALSRDAHRNNASLTEYLQRLLP